MESRVIYKGEPSKVDLVIHIILIFFIVGMFTIWGAIKRQKACIEVYPNEVRAKQGTAYKKSLSYPINSIQGIGIEQGVLGKIFNYGTITISTAGTGYMSIKGMKNPEELKQVIYELKEKAS